jgi:hypothetical protein
MRPHAFLAATLAALATAVPASAGIPNDGYLVFKDLRISSVTEVRAKGGRLIGTVSPSAVHGSPSAACSDPAFVFAGPRWRDFESYRINLSSTPAHISRIQTLIDLLAAHEAWEGRMTTDCPRPPKQSRYEAKFGGLTNRVASLVASLETDGENTASFQSLAGTVCDGATACVVIDYRKKRIREADLAMERDLTRYGFQDFWTTDDRTWWNDVGGRWAVSDVATHEFGHFAGLGHTEASPELTMYTFVHDGAQTLGLGDMLGILARYKGEDDD